ncbi:MAG: hypothetical protein NC121_17865 [Blautia sp.]|nr:hypothetical protein [Blautia sp.]
MDKETEMEKKKTGYPDNIGLPDEAGIKEQVGLQNNRADICAKLLQERSENRSDTKPERVYLPASLGQDVRDQFIPKNYIDIAKWDEKELNGTIAGERLTETINRIDFLMMAYEQNTPTLPTAENVMRQLIDRDGDITAGELDRIWTEICNQYRDEWILRMKLIDLSRGFARKTCEEMILFVRQMKLLRSEIQRIGRENGSPDEIVKDNRQISTWLEIQQIARFENDRLRHEIFYPEGEEL